MAKFNKQTVGGKAVKTAQPRKARPDFHLYAHLLGKWAKTIRGKTIILGHGATPKEPLRQAVYRFGDRRPRLLLTRRFRFPGP